MARVRVPSLSVGIWSDILYPSYQQRQIRDLLTSSPSSDYVEIDSPHGHDAFLIESGQLGPHLERFLHSV